MISIVILSYRNPALLRLCLKSLVQALPRTDDYEVIVVDNATTPETRNVVTEEFSQVISSLRLLPLQENTGYTRGVNEGLRAARGDYILAINYDIILVPGTVQALVAYLEQHPRVGLIAPRLLNFDDSHQHSCFRFYRPLTILYRRLPLLPFAQGHLQRFTLQREDLSGVMPVDWVSGAAFMTTRRAMESVGFLDERLFHYFSDVDWAWRFWENDFTVAYYPMASLYHYHGRTSKGRFGILDPFLNQATRWHIRDAIHYFRKHGIGGRRPTRRSPIQPGLLTT